MSKLASHELNHPRKFMVMITETLKRTIEVDADNQHEAEQMAFDSWRNSEHILGAEEFIDVDFEAVPVTDEPC